MTTAHADQAHAHPEDDHGHSHADHNPHLAHHFDTPEQQYESAKLGMWTFLATEILMFGGLFCAYSIYRGNHPEIFLYANHFLDTFWGAVNTVVLIASSFTMAWGVRCAQLGQKGLLAVMLIITLLGGAGFMCIKSYEYHTKWEHLVFVGRGNAYHTMNGEAVNPERRQHAIDILKEEEAQKHELPGEMDHPADTPVGTGDETSEPAFPASVNQPAPPKLNYDHTQPIVAANRWSGRPDDLSFNNAAAPAPEGTNPAFLGEAPLSDHRLVRETSHAALQWDDLSPPDQQRTSVFFQIYFLMTGLHGIHVLVGMGLMIWLLFRAGGPMIRALVAPGVAFGLALYFVFFGILIGAWPIWLWVVIGVLLLAAGGMAARGLAKRDPEAKGEFGPSYFLPVDLVGLYWHLVDIIWIFLFPLLYLIH